MSDNLRNRSVGTRFDCLVRGHLAELAVHDLLQESKVNVRTDIWDKTGQIDLITESGLTIEVKSSLRPNVDADIQAFIKNRDIKIFADEKDKLKDFYVQCLFDLPKEDRENIVKDLEPADIDFTDCLNNFYIVGFKSKNVISQITETWSFSGSKRKFLKCPIATAQPISELANLIKISYREFKI